MGMEAGRDHIDRWIYSISVMYVWYVGIYMCTVPKSLSQGRQAGKTKDNTKKVETREVSSSSMYCYSASHGGSSTRYD